MRRIYKSGVNWTPSIDRARQESPVTIIGPSLVVSRYVFHIRSRYVYLVVIDESSRQVTKTRKAHGQPPPFFAIRDVCTVSRCICVFISPTRMQPITYSTPGRPPIVRPCPAVLLPLPRTQHILFSLSHSQLLSRRGMVLFSWNGTFLFEHRLICEPIGRAALWRSSRESIYIAGDFCSLSSRAAVLLARFACTGDTIKHRNFYALPRNASASFSPFLCFLVQNIEQTKTSFRSKRGKKGEQVYLRFIVGKYIVFLVFNF